MEDRKAAVERARAARAVARRAVEEHLRRSGRPTVLFYHLTLVADRAVREAGLGRGFSARLPDYYRVLPPGVNTAWTASGQEVVLNPWRRERKAA